MLQAIAPAQGLNPTASIGNAHHPPRGWQSERVSDSAQTNDAS